MRKLIFFASLAFAAPAWAQNSSTCTAGQNITLVAFAFETVTVQTSAIGLTATTYNPSGSGFKAIMAFITSETDTVRWRMDGGAPTDAVGNKSGAGFSLQICQQDLPRFQAIRDAGAASDVPLSVTYFRYPS